MKRKSFVLLIIVSILLLVFAGCSAAYESDENRKNGLAEEVAPGTTTTEIANSQRKIIRNGRMDLESKDVEETYNDLISFVESKGGYEFSNETFMRNDHLTINLVIKVKADHLGDVMDYAGTLATVINKNLSSEDITDKYHDYKTRLETKRHSLDSYYRMLEKADNVQEILSIQSEINALTEDIEAYEGMLKLWESQVDESSLRITINEIDDPLKPKKEVDWSALSFKDMGTLIKNGFTSVVNVIVSILQWLIILIVSALPLILIAGVVLFFVLKNRKKRKKKQALPWQTDKNETETENK